MQQLIHFDPSLRPTAEQALAHPWLATYHDETDEPACPQVFDRWKTLEALETIDDYRDALVREVRDCRREVRNLAAVSPVVDQRVPMAIREETEIGEDSQPTTTTTTEGSTSIPQTPDDIRGRRPVTSRKPSIEEQLPESINYTGSGDPVVAYSRRSIFGMPSRTNSTYSGHRGGSPHVSDGQATSTVAFPSTEYVVPGRHRTGSMYTVGAGSVDFATPEVRRLLRTLSTVSIYESGEGRAGGLADVAPIGKYITQNNRTGDEPIQSEMPKSILGEDSEEGVEAGKSGGSDPKRRFTVL